MFNIDNIFITFIVLKFEKTKKFSKKNKNMLNSLKEFD